MRATPRTRAHGVRRPGWILATALSAAVLLAAPAAAWINDVDANKIDDRIEAVDANGFAFAFEDNDPSKRLKIGVFDGSPLRYAIYVGYDRRPTAADETALVAAGVPFTKPYLYIDYIRTEATFGQIQTIAGLPGVTRVEAIPMMYPTNAIGSRTVRARDSRGLFPPQDWVLFPSARENLGLDGSGVVVAILDTGVNDELDDINAGYPGHEALQGKFLGGGEFFSGQPALNTGLNESENPQDHGGDSYHGTHVAGTAIGTGGPGGVFTGVAPAARLVDCKVLSDAGAGFGAADGVEWCIANMTNDWGLTGADTVYTGIDVLNLSLGCLDCNSDGTSAGEQMVNSAVAAGLVVVIATGNNGGTNRISSPSAADDAISVGASSHGTTLDRTDDLVAGFSNEGPRLDDGDADDIDEMKPDVVAPGTSIVSANGDFTTDGTGYHSLSGTSMATPHVAGVAALIVQANPDLTAFEIKDILRHTAEHGIESEKGDVTVDPFGVDPNYNTGSGWGLVDAYAAAKEALNSTDGVQVTQFRPLGRADSKAVDVNWITQREFSFQGFHVYRAPDQGGSPGAFTRISTVLVPPSTDGDPDIVADDNRTLYTFLDDDESLTPGLPVWYRISWVDDAGTEHLEPPAPATPLSGDIATPCVEPGVLLLGDPTEDFNETFGTSSMDIISVFFAEPFLGDGVDRLVVTMNTDNLQTIDLNAGWKVQWRSPDDTLRFVTMNTFDGPTPQFEYGWIEEGPNTSISRGRGQADAGSFDPDGTIRIEIAHDKVGFTGPGDALRSVSAVTQRLIGGAGTGALAEVDATAAGGPYDVRGNLFCRPPTVACPDDFLGPPVDLQGGSISYELSFVVNNPSSTERAYSATISDANGWIVGGPLGFAVGPVPAGASDTVEVTLEMDPQCRPSAMDPIDFEIEAFDAPTLTASCTTVATCEAPVPALISVFVAESVDAGVELRWEPFSASHVRGWNLYRGASPSTAVIPVNPEPIVVRDGETARFLDIEAPRSGEVFYRLTALLSGGEESLVGFATASAAVPVEFRFELAGPNPFRGSTALQYTLPKRAPVQVAVYDVAGRRVETLVNRVQEPGTYTLDFRLGATASRRLASGVYLVRITAGEERSTIPVIALD